MLYRVHSTDGDTTPVNYNNLTVNYSMFCETCVGWPDVVKAGVQFAALILCDQLITANRNSEFAVIVL